MPATTPGKAAHRFVDPVHGGIQADPEVAQGRIGQLVDQAAHPV
jgi:hypothetical protein